MFLADCQPAARCLIATEYRGHQSDNRGTARTQELITETSSLLYLLRSAVSSAVVSKDGAGRMAVGDGGDRRCS